MTHWENTLTYFNHYYFNSTIFIHFPRQNPPNNFHTHIIQKREVRRMKFIISSLSLAMFQDKNFDLKIHELSEDEFQMLALDGFSHIGQQDVADATGFAYNRESFKARVGDVLLLAQIYHKTLRFYCIQVLESETPLLRSEEEIYIDEEGY